MKHVFIVNPISGKGKAIKYIPIINQYFADNGGDFEIIVTERPKHAKEIAHRYTKEDDVILYSVGGDGTSKEILDGLNEGVTLCVVPAGTGNDFYKSIDNRKLSLEEILKGLIEGEVINIDYGIFNGTSKFMNVSSFGIDADINIYACDYVKVKYNLPGSIVYAYSALKVGTKPKSFHTEMTVDGKKITREPVLIAICNGRAYGGCFIPSPQAKLDDGYFDICMFNGPITLPQFFRLIVKYLSGNHLAEKECEFFHGRNIDIKFNKEIALQVDGENTHLDSATIEMVPSGLSLKVPAGRQVR